MALLAVGLFLCFLGSFLEAYKSIPMSLMFSPPEELLSPTEKILLFFFVFIDRVTPPFSLLLWLCVFLPVLPQKLEIFCPPDYAPLSPQAAEAGRKDDWVKK